MQKNRVLTPEEVAKFKIKEKESLFPIKKKILANLEEDFLAAVKTGDITERGGYLKLNGLSRGTSKNYKYPERDVVVQLASAYLREKGWNCALDFAETGGVCGTTRKYPILVISPSKTKKESTR